MLAVRRMADVFEKSGKDVSIRSIPDDDWKNEEYALYIFAFPVYEQSLPLFVYDWISEIPSQESKTFAAALSTLAGSSGFVKTPLKKLLIKLNFEPVAIKELIFPTNFIYTVAEDKLPGIMKKGLIDAEQYAQEIISGEASWPSTSSIKQFMFPFNRVMARCFSWIFSHYKVDDSCVHCHLCENLCPVNNIKVTDDKVIWGRKCQVCLRCINFCPQKSIRSSICNLPYKAHYIAEDVKAIDFYRKNKSE